MLLKKNSCVVKKLSTILFFENGGGSYSFMDDYPLDTLANQINVSQRQLLRIMHSSLNESLYSYVVRQRVERAVLYMQTEEMNLTKLAGMVGYDNPQSFSKAFKK